MFDLIVRAVEWARFLLFPLDLFPVPEPPVRTDPWRRPWTSPTQEEAQAILRAREEAARGKRKLYYLPPGVFLPLTGARR
ncbi:MULTISPECIES: hypothetical protein [Streptomyces]|uniref:Uncharacterized protein n=1 Tax=Streptomyces tsukubensis (strain DSM 42081 / NBRC 108919 / NRRL 18488 / 9993) TaxID=1114943 RepID=I2N2E2_STRT9|nr:MULTISPECIES: hypothetical protein [Streptomyces]AZK95295.1 hypothetical protein B7R87_16615 [Streptomyces tsukubensis]EIF91189.1 hypothetical protein [Streptomyces tsukubensis NRRL18488]MYS62958.1 hypothetical protein [Streptomyces sp. SID5473]QKM68650.1 hypothetical protein STSU_017180 [Streptomyces tsukubensis NRRL18488]TAI43456.1 hypothetical protein EWI31_16930 [Streptomyces tsukubensis]